MSARDALLERCIAHLETAGFSDLSLREIAAAIGTSHRMLHYHFGSRDGLLVAVVQAMEDRQRAALADLESRTDDLAELTRTFWRRLSDPALAPAERLFFEVYAHAVNGRPWAAAFRESVVSATLAPLVELLVRHGVDPDEAARRARLGLAVTRGLLLDLLATGDKAGVDAAAELFAELVAATPAGPGVD